MALPTPVYLDHHATTPIDPRVLEILERTQREHFGNPSSSGHAFGWAASKLVEEARRHVAHLIGASDREIVFTSGATESNHLALLGMAETYGQGSGHFVTTNLEHESVAGPVGEISRRGGRVSTVAAGTDGRVAVDSIARALEEDTFAVSVIAAQNELGTLQPLRKIGTLCKERGVLFHTDAAQATGKISLDVIRDGVDLLSLSAHKMYGPKGVGALYVRRRDPRVTLSPQMLGGGQERGLRSGTLNVPGIVAMGEACRLATEEMEAEAQRLKELRDYFWGRLSHSLTGVYLNGDREKRLPGNLNVSFSGLGPNRLLGALTVLAVSAGSACGSADAGPSAILTAIGIPADLAASSLRIGLGRFTTREEIDFAADTIIAAVQRLRAESLQ